MKTISVNKYGRERDSQRSKVYKAQCEHSLWGKTKLSLDECKHLVSEITNSRWWKGKGGRWSVSVQDGRGRRSAGGGAGEVTFPRALRIKFIVLHELAHSLTEQQFGHVFYRTPAWHGREFAANYIKLVSRWIGKEAAQELRRLFVKHNVKHRGGRR